MALMARRDGTNLRLWVGLGAGALCAFGLIFLGSSWALPLACVLALLIGGFLGVWTYRDAESLRENERSWGGAALLAWPLTVPPYLVFTRGMRGLVPAAAVLFLFFLLPFSFLAAIVYEEGAAGRLIARGRKVYWETEPRDAHAGKKRALTIFERAVRTDRDNLHAYFMVFSTAFALDRPELASEYRKKLERLGVRSTGWHVTMLHYEDFAARYQLETTGRYSPVRWKEFVFLEKEWDRHLSGFSRKEKLRYALEIRRAAELIGSVRSVRKRSR